MVDPKSEYMATARHRVKYHPGTRLASSCEIDMVPLQGEIRTISLEPGLKFQMKGLGYGHPEWRPISEFTLTSDHRAIDGASFAL